MKPRRIPMPTIRREMKTKASNNRAPTMHLPPVEWREIPGVRRETALSLTQGQVVI
uniref:Uncharacterized protein n=1 Tax=Oryza sativa subsp. japonica TaxID=39947 RepID=Q6ZII3_ORYSJ|nr:hypothetical protein [Oryza sativa Japonica Group]